MACCHHLVADASSCGLVITFSSTSAYTPASACKLEHQHESRLTYGTGGNFQDLIVRSGCAALGAVWAGFAFAARGGDPYVMGAFAVIFMLPMMYRFTLSAHPRSGIVGCLSFTVVSLAAYTDQHQTPMVHIAWTRGLAFVTGVAAALVINWFLWPFVARHELRKSLASMMLHSGILYRAIISKYIYYREGQPPGPEEVVQSEMLEGRLREVFVRIRQLLEMTRHEMVRKIALLFYVLSHVRSLVRSSAFRTKYYKTWTFVYLFPLPRLKVSGPPSRQHLTDPCCCCPCFRPSHPSPHTTSPIPPSKYTLDFFPAAPPSTTFKRHQRLSSLTPSRSLPFPSQACPI